MGHPGGHLGLNVPPGVWDLYCVRGCMGSSLAKPRPLSQKGGTPYELADANSPIRQQSEKKDVGEKV